MYIGYNAQQTLQNERVNDLLEQAQPSAPKQTHAAWRWLALLRRPLTAKHAKHEPTYPCATVGAEANC